MTDDRFTKLAQDVADARSLTLEEAAARLAQLERRVSAPALSAQPCASHHHHEPTPAYTELHHVIPQAWQAFWRPPAPWPNAGPSPDRHDPTTGLPFVLFDARTVALCRTGHGNVHHWLVELTHYYATHAGISVGQLEHDARLAIRAAGEHPNLADYAIAAQALERWTTAGGTIDQLVAAHLWGEI